MPTNATYKDFIDELVELSRGEVIAKRIREDGHSERSNDTDLPFEAEEKQRKDFFLALLPQQREIVAELLEEARSGAIHDVACFLDSSLASGDLKMTWKGEGILESPYASMHFDFIARREGDVWPVEDSE